MLLFGWRVPWLAQKIRNTRRVKTKTQAWGATIDPDSRSEGAFLDTILDYASRAHFASCFALRVLSAQTKAGPKSRQRNLALIGRDTVEPQPSTRSSTSVIAGGTEI
ncbi:hypothetical protein EI94DRAFT_1744186 [Lactarius quietus]|nr:hypothetical protein EI94DRAFT_1744186 [Lactarius quietus]